MTIQDRAIKLTKEFANAMDRIVTEPKDSVSHIYNPLQYAAASHFEYLKRYLNPNCRYLLLGMNPGPFGMAQTGIPFGEISIVKNWLEISAAIKKPKKEHPKRPITGFECTKSEVSGRRLWGYFQDKFGTPKKFFQDYFITNYCPLVFMEESGKNKTPNNLSKTTREQIFPLCDEYLRNIVELLNPEIVIGIGKFAEKMAGNALKGLDIRVETILHPSPASPLANRGWAEAAEKQLQTIVGVSGNRYSQSCPS